jgi:DNA mismatch repair ATPase MutL
MLPLYLKSVISSQKPSDISRSPYIRILGLAIRLVTSSFLQEKGETGVRAYQEDVLQGAVKHLNMTFFSDQERVFQQDSVPAQKNKTTQEWLWRKLLAFISTENWLSGSAHLKTLDNKLWAVLEDMACRKCHKSLESLRRSPMKTVAEIPLETDSVATAEWPEGLKACVEA